MTERGCLAAIWKERPRRERAAAVFFPRVQEVSNAVKRPRQTNRFLG